MTETTWHKLWLLALIANDVPQREAHVAFYERYGNQPIDLNIDPIADALALLPNWKSDVTPARSHIYGRQRRGNQGLIA
jgi:hypothetical protein